MKTEGTANIKPVFKASVDTSTKEAEGKGICTCGTNFETILQKILKDGLEVCLKTVSNCHTCF